MVCFLGRIIYNFVNLRPKKYKSTDCVVFIFFSFLQWRVDKVFFHARNRFRENVFHFLKKQINNFREKKCPYKRNVLS